MRFRARDKQVERVFRRAMLWSILGSICLYGVSASNPVLVIFGSFGALAGWMYAGRGPSGIPRAAINGVLVLIVGVWLLNVISSSFDVESFALFSVFLLVLKLFDLRNPRDAAQVVVLSIALVIAAALTSNSLPTGVLLILMCVAHARTVMLFRVVVGISKARLDDWGFETGSRVDFRANQVVVMFLGGLIAVGVFMVMPRDLGSSAFGQWGGVERGMRVGFSDDVELGRPGRISSSPTPVMRVSVRDRDHQLVGQENGRPVYLRGSVLTEYRDGKWVSGQEQRVPIGFRTRIVEPDQPVLVVEDESRASWTHEYMIVIEREDRLRLGYLFTPWKPLEIRSGDKRARIGVDKESGMILVSDDPIGDYRVRAVDVSMTSIEPMDRADRPVIDTGVVSDRITELARRVVRGAGLEPDPGLRDPKDDQRVVRAIETHLRTQYSYSLESLPVDGGMDATEWFLFESGVGHCEYYASALALMSRAVGVDSRVITGYVAAEFNDVNSTYVVRQSNAHAWVEAKVGQDQWRTFDGTPQDEFFNIHEPDQSVVRSLMKVYDAIQHAWVSVVVGYDSGSRSALLGGIEPDWDAGDFSTRIQDRFAAGRWRLVRAALVQALFVFVMIMALGLGALLISEKRVLKGRWLRRLRFHRRDGVEVLRDRIEMVLNENDLPRSKGIPLRIHLEEISRSPEGYGREMESEIRMGMSALYRAMFSSGDREEISRDVRRAIERLKGI